MLPWELLDETVTPGGASLKLTRRGDEYRILADGKLLMSSRLKGSEEELARLGCDRAAKLAAPSVLVGGLGVGFTLRAALDAVPERATVVVAELVASVVEWNRGPLGEFAKNPLADPRVKVEVGDVGEVMRRGRGRFDAILLDVDNGPAAFTRASNAGLYDDAGVLAMRGALRAKGVVSVWSAEPDTRFEDRLRRHGFVVETHVVRSRLARGGARHTIFVGRT